MKPIQEVKAGTASRDITPPPGTWMSGFAHRPGPAERVADPLFAKALVLDDGKRRIAIVSLDIIQLDNSLLAPVRRAVTDRTGIPAANLLINATHTHSGPAVFRFNRLMGPVERKLWPALMDGIVQAVEEAFRKREEADLFYGEGEIKLGSNRRQLTADGRVRMGTAPDRPYDPLVPVLRVDSRGDKRAMAVLFSHAMHPVILGPRSRAISAEFPGVACQTVIPEVGMAATAMFLQGCCGNINPPPAKRSYAAMEETGQKLGRLAAAVAESAPPLTVCRVDAASTAALLPLQAEPVLQYEREHERWLEAAREATDPVAERLARGRARWAKRLARVVREGRAPRSRKVVLQAVRAGELAIAAIQAEPFVETGMAIRSRSPFQKTITLGYTNGCCGYLPTAESYPEGGYEVVDSIRYYGSLMYAPEAEAILVKRSVELLQSLHKK